VKNCIVAVFVLALPLAGCGSSDSKTTTVVAFQGTLSPAPGLAASDFTVWGPSDDAPAAVSASGAWSANGYPHRTGILFATPKSGSAAAASLGAESGLYMTPAADSARVVKGGDIGSTDGGAGYSAELDGGALDGGTPTHAGTGGAAYGVATDGDMAMDATTTVISMLIMHPMLAHPSSDVSAAQLRWMTARMASGWPCLAQAAVVYDADLLARLDFSVDVNFTTPFAACLDDVATMPVTTPTVPTGKQAKQLLTLPPSPTGPFLDNGDQPVDVNLANAGIQVSSVAQVSADNKAAIVEPSTKNGTGLDYYYTVRQIDDSLSKQGTDSPIFASPEQLVLHSTGSVLASGFIPSSSYFGYLDVVGNSIETVTSFVTGLAVKAPNRNVTLPSQHMYEVRFFSGGFGFGVTADAYAFASANFSTEHNDALYQNVAMAVVEMIAIIPGAGEVLAEGEGGKILQEVVQKTIVDLRKLLADKGANVTGDDVYNLMYGVVKTALDAAVSSVTSDVQAGVGKRLLGWLVGGGKKAIATVVGLPGKVAKGGALGNRAFRLSSPESVMEYTIVAVGYKPGNCEPFMNTMVIQYGAYPADCKACANLACPSECNGCGSACLATGKTIATSNNDACQICNATGKSSDACSKAFLKSMNDVAYTPGAGQPQEMVQNVRVCIINACDACLAWYSAQAVCVFPTQ